MRSNAWLLILAVLLLGGCSTQPPVVDGEPPASPASGPVPLSIGETFTIRSSVLDESRIVNILKPTIYGEPIDGPVPVLYVLDGGVDEDFLHLAGLVQVLVSNGGMRPMLVVGVQNTQRRRDMTGPTTISEDRAIAPVVGGSADFRRFLRDELKPEIARRYAVTNESAIIGESLAGLFTVETFFLEPALFDTFIAIDPSLWWAGGELVNSAPGRLRNLKMQGKTLFIASSNEPGMIELTNRLARDFEASPPPGVRFILAPMPAESHATIFHPAAIGAFRAVLPPVKTPQ